MMEILVQPPEQTVIVNGSACRMNAKFPSDISLMRWVNGRGEIHYLDGRPSAEAHYDLFKPWYDLFNATRKLEEAQRKKAEEKAKLEAEERQKQLPLKVRVFSDPEFPHAEVLMTLWQLVVDKKATVPPELKTKVDALMKKHEGTA